jgi:hypothetical protein
VSYGRTPFYIYPCACDGTFEGESNGHPQAEHVAFSAGGVAIERAQLAQFVAKADARGELDELVRQGANLEADETGVTILPPPDVDPAKCCTDQLLGWAANELQRKRPELAEALRARMMHLRSFPSDHPAIAPLSKPSRRRPR